MELWKYDDIIRNLTKIWIANQQVTIPALGLIKLDTGLDNLGNQVFSGWNNLNVVAGNAGDYRVYARFEAYGQIIESSWEFKVQ